MSRKKRLEEARCGGVCLLVCELTCENVRFPVKEKSFFTPKIFSDNLSLGNEQMTCNRIE